MTDFADNRNGMQRASVGRMGKAVLLGTVLLFFYQ